MKDRLDRDQQSKTGNGFNITGSERSSKVKVNGDSKDQHELLVQQLMIGDNFSSLSEDQPRRKDEFKHKSKVRNFKPNLIHKRLLFYFFEQGNAYFLNEIEPGISDNVEKVDFDLSLYNLAPTSTSSKHESRKSDHNFTGSKAKASTSANGLLIGTSEPKVTASLAISYSSPNLTTNASFSSSSESEFEQIEILGVSNRDSILKLNNFLEIEDASSVDENDANEDDGISGENDVEYAELTQRMVPPVLAQKNSQTNQHRGEEQQMGIVDEMMILSLFEDSTGNIENGARASTSSSSSSSTKSARNPVTSANILESLLEPGKSGPLSIYNNNLGSLNNFEKIDGNSASTSG